MSAFTAVFFSSLSVSSLLHSDFQKGSHMITVSPYPNHSSVISKALRSCWTRSSLGQAMIYSPSAVHWSDFPRHETQYHQALNNHFEGLV